MKKEKNNWKLVIGHWTLRRQGFSLIEVVFAMTFLTLIVFGVVSLQSSNLALINTHKNEIQAHFLANQGLQIAGAIAKTSGYTVLACGDGADCKITSGINYSIADKIGLGEEIDSLFYRYYSVDNTLPNALAVTMTVDWEDNTGNHSTSAKRIIF